MKQDLVLEYIWPNTIEIVTARPEVRIPTDHLNLCILNEYLAQHPELARRTAHA